MTGTIPSSPALAEASISDRLSKDPYEMTPDDRKNIVATLREQRVKWEALEASTGGGRKPKAAFVTGKSLGDLGL